MLRFLLLVLLSGCILHSPQNIKKNNKKQEADWLQIYNNEIKIAIENEDTDAFHFFLQEYVKERKRLKNN